MNSFPIVNRHSLIFLAMFEVAAGCGGNFDVGDNAVAERAVYSGPQPQSALAEITSEGGSEETNLVADNAPFALVQKEGFGWAITSDGTRVFWAADGDTHSVVKGCDPMDCASTIRTYAVEDRYVDSMLAAAGSIYWDGKGSLRSCAISGCDGSPLTLARVSSPAALRADETHLYWMGGAAPGMVVRCALGGCGESPELVAFPNEPQDFAVDDTSVYVTTAPATQADGQRVGQLLRFAKPGTGSGEPTVLADNQVAAGPVAVGPNDVYWIAEKALFTCPKTGCADAPRKIADLEFSGLNLVLDGDTAYFWTTVDFAFVRELVRCPVLGQGGGPQPLSTGDFSLAVNVTDQTLGLAITATHLCWLSPSPSQSSAARYDNKVVCRRK
jgi:hypothetical protein